MNEPPRNTDRPPRAPKGSALGPSDPGIGDKVRFLSQPSTYPERPDQVERVESHMAWVFLTNQHAFKLKKPVRYSYLDFSTCEARRRDCELELQLNRRLAPDIYLRVIPLVFDPLEGLRLGGDGPVVDWLVQMRRLPAEQMLDSAIEQRTVREEAVRRAGRLLGKFYLNSPPVGIGAAEWRKRFAEEIELNEAELNRCDVRLQDSLLETAVEAQRDFLRQRRETLVERQRLGRVIDAHGDLRPEHVCLTDPPAVIDCLEFNRRFRVLDAASDFAFLTLECDRLGGGPVSGWLWETYRETTGDSPDPQLLAFYQSQHALTRARLAAWHLDEPGDSGPVKWESKVREYLRCASVTARLTSA